MDAHEKNSSYGSVATLISLLNEYTQAFGNQDVIEHAIRDIDMLERQIPKWGDPKYYSKAIQNYQAIIERFCETLKLKHDASKIKQMIISKQLNRLIDIIDKTTEAVEKSTQYEDKSLQVERFWLMLNSFHTLMENLIGQTSKIYDNAENLKNLLELKQQYCDPSELLPSPHFNFMLFRFGLGEIPEQGRPTVESEPTSHELPYLPTASGRELLPDGTRGSHSHFTLEDLFTLIHQNSLYALSQLSMPCSLDPSRFPKKLRDMLDVVTQNNAERYFGIEFTSSDFKYPVITLNYNMPLAVHSGVIALQYDVIFGEMRAKICVYGGNERNRWNEIELRLNYFVRESGLKIYQNPRYVGKKNYVEFDVSFTTIDTARAFHQHCLAGVSQLSFHQGVSYKPDFYLNLNYDNIHLEALRELSLTLKNHAKQRGIIDVLYTAVRLLPMGYYIARRENNFDINRFIIDNIEIIMKAKDSNLISYFGAIIGDSVKFIDNKQLKNYGYLANFSSREQWLQFCKATNKSNFEKLVILMRKIEGYNFQDLITNNVLEKISRETNDFDGIYSELSLQLEKNILTDSSWLLVKPKIVTDNRYPKEYDFRATLYELLDCVGLDDANLVERQALSLT